MLSKHNMPLFNSVLFKKKKKNFPFNHYIFYQKKNKKFINLLA